MQQQVMNSEWPPHTDSKNQASGGATVNSEKQAASHHS